MGAQTDLATLEKPAAHAPNQGRGRLHRRRFNLKPRRPLSDLYQNSGKIHAYYYALGAYFCVACDSVYFRLECEARGHCDRLNGEAGQKKGAGVRAAQGAV